MKKYIIVLAFISLSCNANPDDRKAFIERLNAKISRFQDKLKDELATGAKISPRMEKEYQSWFHQFKTDCTVRSQQLQKKLGSAEDLFEKLRNIQPRIASQTTK